MATVLFSGVGSDQASKKAAVAFLKDSPPLHYLGDTLRLTYLENPGSWGGFAANSSWGVRLALLNLVPLLLLLVVCSRLLSRTALPRGEVVCLSLVLAGGIGNMLDRLIQGYVVDFLYIGYHGIGTNIFNIADMALLAGTLGLIYSHLRDHPPRPTAKP